MHRGEGGPLTDGMECVLRDSEGEREMRGCGVDGRLTSKKSTGRTINRRIKRGNLHYLRGENAIAEHQEMGRDPITVVWSS